MDREGPPQSLTQNNRYVRFEVFTAVKIQVKVFWVVTPCSVVVGHHTLNVSLLYSPAALFLGK
jgi:hypothetical protein